MKAAEALSASDLSEARNEHYNLDDKLRRMIGHLTLAQKREIVANVEAMAQKIKDEAAK